MKFFPVLALFVSLSCTGNTFIPEASGGAKVGSILVMAGDEEPAALWIGNDITSMTKTKVPDAKWNDMEALATLNNRMFFATTSHSLTKKGKRKSEREQLFLFSLDGNQILIQKTWNLRDSLLSYMIKNLSSAVDAEEVSNGTPDTGGLNVEGLTYLDGKLYLGLRSPLTKDNQAIILVLNNPENSPVVSGHALVDLKGNGIRSLETDGEKILVISGSRDDSDTNFGLHEYAPGARAASLLSVRGFSELMRPESVIKENEQSLIFLQDFEQTESQDVLVRLNH